MIVKSATHLTTHLHLHHPASNPLPHCTTEQALLMFGGTYDNDRLLDRVTRQRTLQPAANDKMLLTDYRSLPPSPATTFVCTIFQPSAANESAHLAHCKAHARVAWSCCLHHRPPARRRRRSIPCASALAYKSCRRLMSRDVNRLLLVALLPIEVATGLCKLVKVKNF